MNGGRTLADRRTDGRTTERKTWRKSRLSVAIRSLRPASFVSDGRWQKKRLTTTTTTMQSSTRVAPQVKRRPRPSVRMPNVKSGNMPLYLREERYISHSLSASTFVVLLLESIRPGGGCCSTASRWQSLNLKAASLVRPARRSPARPSAPFAILVTHILHPLSPHCMLARALPPSLLCAAQLAEMTFA